MRDERELLVDCLERLNRSGLPYMLTGSMASNYWGVPRSTHDLDFVLLIEPAQVEAFVATFRDGFFLQVESVRQVFRPPFQFNAIDEQSALKVDFWLLKNNAFEQQAFAHRLAVKMFGVSACLSTAEDVVLHKLYWNQIPPSDRQLSDAAGIVSVQGSRLDRPYMRGWADILGVRAELDALMDGRIKPKST
jgi:hypothetical protein